MNGPGDIPTTDGNTTERPCGLTSLIPSFGMSCRGRAEAFARRLQSRLRTLGSQTLDSPTNDEEAIITSTDNTWISQDGHEQVTSIQPLRQNSNEADSFFDFDCEPESPGSPADECEYSRLIETTSTTPQNDYATESGYICASPLTPENGSQASQSSSDGPYFDPEISEGEPKSLTNEYYDCIDVKRETSQNTVLNGHMEKCKTHITNDSSDSLSDSLPISQDSTSTNTTIGTQSSLTFTGVSSVSNNTLQDVVLNELQHNSIDVKMHNGHHDEECSTDDQAENEILDNKSPSNETLDVNIEGNEISMKLSVCEPTTNKESQNLMNIEPFKRDGEAESKNNTKDDSKHLSSCDTDDDDDCRPQRVRRCSSLKTGKTPPGTPGRKKIVRFADVLGLDLADVKTFLDEIPTIPKSAYEDLEIVDVMEPLLSLGPRPDKILMPLFQQPGGLTTFLDIVRDKQVSLENAAVTDVMNLTITGSVRVRNLDFHKSVHIRYTLDSWRSFADLQARYVENSCDGFSDKFTFTLFGNSLTVGQRLEFAVRFQCKGQQFWDSNYGSNYCFQCLPAAAPLQIKPILPHHESPALLTSSDGWVSGSFY